MGRWIFKTKQSSQVYLQIQKESFLQNSNAATEDKTFAAGETEHIAPDVCVSYHRKAEYQKPIHISQ